MIISLAGFTLYKRSLLYLNAKKQPMKKNRCYTFRPEFHVFLKFECRDDKNKLKI